MTRADSPSFVVMKFGGTSVSSRRNWDSIVGLLQSRLVSTDQLLVVHSAISGMTDRLEQLLIAALAGASTPALAEIAAQHAGLAAELGIELPAGLRRHHAELEKIAGGVALVGEVSDGVRARVMAAGELMATELGAAFLSAQGLPVTLIDARSLLRAESRRSGRGSALSATCEFAPDLELAARLASGTRVLLTQGFIAADEDGQTVLLGRGGSDTSAAYLAAKLQATRLEIWTDVPGLFSANPHRVPTARLLKALHYDEAQEIASNGAKVLHPRCILPVRQHRIPLHVLATHAPQAPGTIVSAEAGASGAQVKAIALRKGITLISMDSPGMWHQAGFLADAFAVFKAHGLSVDLVSTSETNVTVSLDPQANTLDGEAIAGVVSDLGSLCKVRVIGPCASLSLLGRNIRAILHRLGEAFELFEEQKIYLVSQAANDLNFSFVIDEDQGDRLVVQLHDLLIQAAENDPVLGPTWQQLTAVPRAVTAEPVWWEQRREALLGLLGERDAAYVYDLPTIEARARSLSAMRSLSRSFYAIKANSHTELLRRIVGQGLSLECVSRGEIERATAVVGEAGRDRLLFTPNFAPREEYRWALEQGITLTVDNLYVLRAWPELFRGHELFVRVDTGRGHGHHHHVRTAGVHAKFGVPLFELGELRRAADAAGAKITGLHAHVGSGNFDVSLWRELASTLAEAATEFPAVTTLDLGGGLGVPDRPGRSAVDLWALDATLAEFKAEHPRFNLWMEPGRFVVADGGVLLARVTQLKGKGSVRYLGVATGMNSLIRPALYGAYHQIVNLTRWGERATELYNVVGPVCESADVLGHDRWLPPSEEGDVMLIATAGAYGHVMGSGYNLRPTAEELLLG